MLRIVATVAVFLVAAYAVGKWMQRVGLKRAIIDGVTVAAMILMVSFTSIHGIPCFLPAPAFPFSLAAAIPMQWIVHGLVAFFSRPPAQRYVIAICMLSIGSNLFACIPLGLLAAHGSKPLAITPYTTPDGVAHPSEVGPAILYVLGLVHLVVAAILLAAAVVTMVTANIVLVGGNIRRPSVPKRRAGSE